MSFEESLEQGKVAESAIARWLMSRGNMVLPAYEKAEKEYKGPQLFASEFSLVTPDMVVFGENVIWVEAKHKTQFAVNRTHGVYTTGIDLHHWKEYQQVASNTGLPVWILFLHKPGNGCPSGLFGDSVEALAGSVHHVWKSPHPGQRHGMVYWSYPPLKRIASYQEVTELTPRDFA